MLGEETQAGEYLAPGHVLVEEIQASSYAATVHAEESDIIDDYSVPEPQEVVSEHDDRTDEIPVEEPVASLPNSTSRVPSGFFSFSFCASHDALILTVTTCERTT
ncbi:putative G3BP-like protein [Iris pallida]|uniref:G3BP-like protein n=1 Tax=Iris pallida TaxID=29817 RepID=A0AAX6DHF8_IRIPA|nr:putative G3BP-like protein [Iris pallida]